MMRLSHLAYTIFLSSEPAEMQGHTLKHNIDLQPGTEFAKRGPIKLKYHDHDGLDHGICLCPRPKHLSTEGTEVADAMIKAHFTCDAQSH